MMQICAQGWKNIHYAYKRGERALSPEEQQWIRNYVKSFGYHLPISRVISRDYPSGVSSRASCYTCCGPDARQ